MKQDVSKVNVSNIEKFKPSQAQLKYLEVFLTAPLAMTKQDLCKKAGISTKTEWQWQQNPKYAAWFNEQVEKAMEASLGEIYRHIKRIAKNKVDAQKLFLQRFDRKFVEKKQVNVEFDEEMSKKVQELADEELRKL